MTALNLNLLNAFTPASSGVYTFSVTRDQIIRQMMLDIGALDPYESPTASEISDCSFKLNLLTKQWMGNTDFAPGLKEWTRKRADLFLGYSQYVYNLGQTGDHWVDSTAGLAYPQAYGQTTLIANGALNATVLSVASVSQFNINDYVGIQVGSDIFWTRCTAIGTGTVTITSPGLPAAANANAYVWNYTVKGVRPLKILTSVLRDIYNTDTPLPQMLLERYELLPTKTANTNIADPTQIFYEAAFKSQAPNGALYLDVGGAQDVTKHIHCVYLAPTEAMLNPGDAPDYSAEWFRPLVLGLGKDCCGMFDCVWTQDLEDNLADALRIARQANPETTDIYFEVNAESPYE